MSFHPSPSIDCHMTPMEVVLPFIQESQQRQEPLNANGYNVYTAPRSRRRSSASVVQKVCCDYHTRSGQYIFRCPPNSRAELDAEGHLLCLTQITTVAFYQALLSEFLGTMLLTLICTSTGLPIASKTVPDLHGALVAGFTIATLVVGFGHMSGAHINPAVTVSFLVAAEIDIVRAICYIGIQLLGATAGSAILSLLAPVSSQGNLGVNTITAGVSLPQAVGVEIIITFLLCFTVQAICDTKRDDLGGSKALTVGLAITIGCLFGGPYTGASMNPARSFGPAVMTNTWKNHWVYWCGPMIGSVLAGVIYTYVLRQRPPIVVRTESHSNDDN